MFCCLCLYLVSQVGLEIPEDNVPIKLRQKMESVGIDSNLCRPGQYNGLICPMVCGFEHSLLLLCFCFPIYVFGSSSYCYVFAFNLLLCTLCCYTEVIIQLFK